jgi:hypothetical protein
MKKHYLRDQSGHHHCIQCLSTHQEQGSVFAKKKEQGGGRSPLFGKENLHHLPLQPCNQLRNLISAIPYVGTEHFTCIAGVILLFGNYLFLTLFSIFLNYKDLYVFFLFCRVDLSNNQYRVFKLPSGINSDRYNNLILGKSKKWVYFAFLHGRRLRVLFLYEFGDEAEWVLKYDIDLEAVLYFSRDKGCRINTPWILHDEGNNGGDIVEENLEWDSDNDDVLEDESQKFHYTHASIFGFHPYKEIAFLYVSSARIVAFHLNRPKVQGLGALRIKYRGDVIDTAFVYMPCWFGELSLDNVSPIVCIWPAAYVGTIYPHMSLYMVYLS